MKPSHCRWGILGTAGIARKNWQAIRLSGNGVLSAVASRSAGRAESFVAECQAQVPHDPLPHALGSYEELIADPEIDAVYIPLPTGLRKGYVLAAARAGKHVLCEKPCGRDAAEVAEMVAACEEAGVQFMDGVMFMHSRRLEEIRRVLDEGELLGDLKRIASQFSFYGGEDFESENIRLDPELEPMGSLGDLGWYCARFILWTMRYEMPLAIRARMIRESGRGGAVPVTLSAELVFERGVTASLFCSFETEHQQWVHLSGTKGNLHVPDFVLPFHGPELAFTVERSRFEIDGCDFSMERHPQRFAVREYGNSHPTSQEARLFRRFGELVLGGQPDPHWPAISLKTQKVLDACLLSARDGGHEVAL